MRISDWSSDVCSSDLKAIVTGSTAGIGRAIAEGLARAGAAVVINGRTQKRVDAALREMHVLLPGAELTGVAADVATAQGCAALFGQAPDADILVNNAGTAILNNFFDQDDSSEEHTSELQSLMRNSNAGLC